MRQISIAAMLGVTLVIISVAGDILFRTIQISAPTAITPDETSTDATNARDSKKPREILTSADRATVTLRMSYTITTIDPETKNPTVMQRSGTLLGTIITITGYPEPLVLTAGHAFMISPNITMQCFACFNFELEPAIMELVMLDQNTPANHGLDFSLLRFTKTPTDKRIFDYAIPLVTPHPLRISEELFAGTLFNWSRINSHGWLAAEHMIDFNMGRPQTLVVDYALNHGGSGSACFNEYGEIVGINVQILIDPHATGNNIPRSLAGVVPITDVLRTISDNNVEIFLAHITHEPLIIKRSLFYQILIFNSRELTEQDWRERGILARPKKNGVYIYGFLNVFSPAASILQIGDRIISCNGHVVNDKMEVYKEIFFSYNQLITLEIERDGVQQKVLVPLVLP